MKSKIKILVSNVALFCLLFLVISCGIKPIDGSGNEYDVIKIGDQYWLKQNLRTTKYIDGTPINTFIENNSDCFANNIGWYANQPETHIKDSVLYGNFYNWQAVNSGKLAPKGWHIPTKYDWDKLDAFLSKDGKNNNANKLRATTKWNYIPDIGNGLDTYGFSAYPTGYKNFGTGYTLEEDNKKQYTVFWTSTIDYNHKDSIGRIYPYSIIVGIANPMLVKVENLGCPNFGYSVRCVKD